MIVHYVADTGQIMAFGSGPTDDRDGADSYLDGCKVLETDEQPIDGRTQRVDPLTRKIVLKDKPDPPPDQMPAVRRAVAFELATTDKYMLPDFPIDDAARAAWVAYRKSLRDASKGNATAAAMLAAIPSRPDGIRLADMIGPSLRNTQ